ncbi:hypothetical protein F4604DRAFT_1764544, partial [Suillus subluteus]
MDHRILLAIVLAFSCPSCRYSFLCTTVLHVRAAMDRRASRKHSLARYHAMRDNDTLIDNAVQICALNQVKSPCPVALHPTPLS